MDITGEIEQVWADALDAAAGPSLWSVVVFAPARGVSAVVRDESVYNAGELIHGFIAQVVERAVAAGALDWNTAVLVSPRHVEGTRGVLAAGLAPVRLPLHTVVALMLTTGDAGAAAALVDACGGIVSVNDTLARAGYERSRVCLSGGVADPRADQWQADPHLPSHTAAAVTCARDVFGMLRDCAASPVIGPMLAAYQHGCGLARTGGAMQHVAAATSGVRHDVGVAELSGEPGDVCYTLVLTDGRDRPATPDDAVWLAMADAHAAAQAALLAARD